MKKIYSMLAASILMSITASFAQPGTLDSSFGGDGKVSTKIQVSSDAKSVAVRSDGKILVAGSSYDGMNDNFALTRYKADGTMDGSFGRNGKATTDFGGDDYTQSLAIQPDNKIVVAGYSNRGSVNNDFALVRYGGGGKTDSTFGINGKVTTNFGDDEYGMSVAIQSNGKIVLVGYGYDGIANYKIILSRYLQTGTLDSSFGINGKVINAFDGSNVGRSIAIQSDGKILVAGTNYNTHDFTLVRFQRNGKPDSTFGTYGKVNTDFGGDDGGSSIAIQADGKIVVAGSSFSYATFSSSFAIARYKPNGQPDNTFGVNGKVITSFQSYAYGQDVKIQADGKIVMAGFAFTGSNYDFALVRYTLTGKPDSSFGVNSKVTTDFGSDDYGSAIAIQTDGKIIEIGGANSAFTEARYSGDFTGFAKQGNPDLANLQKQETNTVPNILIFPNPVKDIVYIRALSSSAKTISVIDITGRLLQKAVTASTGYSFNIKQLPAGTYCIVVDEGERITKLKFIKE